VPLNKERKGFGCAVTWSYQIC